MPQGLSQCVVELPGDERLASISLDGHPALARPRDEAALAGATRRADLPQVLQVVSRNVESVDSRANFVELRRPLLTQADRPMPVELCLWSLIRPTTMGTPRGNWRGGCFTRGVSGTAAGSTGQHLANGHTIGNRIAGGRRVQLVRKLVATIGLGSTSRRSDREPGSDGFGSRHAAP